MQTYTYKLNDSDYIQYLEKKTSEDRMIQFRCILFTFAPIPLLAIILYFANVHFIWVYGILALLFFIWIPVSKKILRSIINSKIQDNLKKFGNRKYNTLEVSIDNKKISVLQNNKRTEDTVIGYQVFGTLFVLFLQTGNTLLIPTRALNNDISKLLSEL